MNFTPFSCRAALALLICLAVASCGGGGGDDPPPPPNITVAGGGTVRSADGKVELIVADNSASVAAVASIAKEVAEAAIAGDPNFVPESAYRYTGPDITFAPAANWEFASPEAVGASAGAAHILSAGPGTARIATALSSNIDPDRMCSPTYAATFGKLAHNVYIDGDTCPSGCKKLGQIHRFALCAPATDVAVVSPPTPCPPGTEDFTDEVPYQSLIAQYGIRVCRPAALAAPWIANGPLTVDRPLNTCVVLNGRFVCKRRVLPNNGIYAIYKDITPPAVATVNVTTPLPNFMASTDSGLTWQVAIPVAGSQTVPLTINVNATQEPVGLSQIELIETVLSILPNGTPKFTSVVRWTAVPVGSSLPVGTKSYSSAAGAVSFVYADTDNNSRWFYVRAYDWAGNARQSYSRKFSRAVAGPPTIASFNASPVAVQPPAGPVTLSWSITGAASAAIDQGIGVVDPNAGSVVANVIANTTFTLTATSPLGAVSTQTASVTIAADTTPPTVNLAPSPSTVLVPGSTTLVANVTDNIGVTKVEFYRGSALINTDTAAPFQHTVNLTAADIGSIGFTAKAFDAQNNAATSAVATVTVSAPASGDTYASPSGVDTGNTICAQTTPCLSIAKAAGLAQAGRTVWLSDGTYTPATQPVAINLPAGLTLRALTPGMAVLQQSIALAGNATVVGLTLDRGVAQAFSTMLSASSGTITLEGLKIIGRLNGPAFSFSGSAQVTIAPGSVADTTDQLDAQGGAGLVALSGNARLTINGGSFTGSGMGTGSNVGPLAIGFAAFQVTGNSQLTINNATVQVKGNGIFVGDTGTVTLNNTTLTASAMNGPGAGIGSLAGTPTITLNGSTVSGFKYGPYSAGIVVGANSSLINATLSLTNSVISGNDNGLVVSGGSLASTTTLIGTGVQIKNNTLAGAIFANASSVDINGGEISGNGTQDSTIAGSYSVLGGLWFGNGGLAYSVKLRNLAVINNRSLVTGNTNTASNSGVTLGGTAASSFDLGTAASPGGNTFTGNTTGNQTTGINVVVPAGVVVNAVGNTFIAGAQGSSALGKFVLGTSPCGATTCLVTTGAGANYRVTSGSLRLAE